jgi:D-glycero-alpha-D-manno-heptose 1-phosphate guanylyltransferase
MEAIILAGGFGTRLQSVVSDVPKPMAPVNGKPFLHYLVAHLAKNGVSRIVLCTGYLHETIERYFGEIYLGVDMAYSLEKEPLGTGGALVEALPLVKNEVFLLLNGDTFFGISPASLSELRLRTNADIAVALVNLPFRDRYGSVQLKDNRIVSFGEKGVATQGPANGGVYLVRKSVIQALDLPHKFSFEKDVLEKRCGTLSIAGIVLWAYFVDIGIPEDYLRAQLEHTRLETADLPPSESA